MATAHICHVDCKLDLIPAIGPHGMYMRREHMMYATEPSSAAGRYQWEQNAAIKLQGRRAWRATGQGQSRECRVWDYRRATEPEEVTYLRYGVMGRRLGRELAAL